MSSVPPLKSTLQIKEKNKKKSVKISIFWSHVINFWRLLFLNYFKVNEKWNVFGWAVLISKMMLIFRTKNMRFFRYLNSHSNIVFDKIVGWLHEKNVTRYLFLSHWSRFRTLRFTTVKSVQANWSKNLILLSTF